MTTHAARWATHLPWMATAPVMLDGVLYRVLEGPSQQRAVQEWTGGYWMPSLRPLYRIGDAMMATPEQLRRMQVPELDWAGTPRPVYVTPTITPLDAPPASVQPNSEADAS